MQVVVVVRESGRLKPDYSLPFELPELPRVGDYISVQRPDQPEPWGEDMIVRQIWWRLNHPETGGYGSGDLKVGSVQEIFVECDPAVGPYSSDQWRDGLAHALASGQAEELKVARLSFRQDAMTKPGE